MTPLASTRATLLAAAMAHLATAGAEYVTPVRRLMHTLLSNVLRAPDEIRVRRVKLQHPQIASMLGGDPAALLVLELCGFTVSEDGMKAQMPDSEVADVAMLERRLRVLSSFQPPGQRGRRPVASSATSTTSIAASITTSITPPASDGRKRQPQQDTERSVFSRPQNSSHAHALHPHLHA